MGSLLQLDTPEKILHEPAYGFVEEFIGKHRIIQNPDLMSVEDVMAERVVTSLPIALQKNHYPLCAKIKNDA